MAPVVVRTMTMALMAGEKAKAKFELKWLAIDMEQQWTHSGSGKPAAK